MKKSLLLGGLFALTLVLTGCSNPLDSRPQFAVTMRPLELIAKEVAGDDANIRLLIPAEEDPRGWSPNEKTTKQLEGVLSVFAVEESLDGWSEELSKAAGAEHEYVYVGGKLHKNDDGSVNPYYWLEPRYAQLIATNIAEELSEHDAVNEGAYYARAQVIVDELGKKDGKWIGDLRAEGLKEVATYHDVWKYFFDRVNIQTAAVLEDDLADGEALAEDLKSRNLHTVFTAPLADQEKIETFAQEHEFDVLVLDPFAMQEYESFVAFMETQVYQIRIALEDKQVRAERVRFRGEPQTFTFE